MWWGIIVVSRWYGVAKVERFCDVVKIFDGFSVKGNSLSGFELISWFIKRTEN